MKLFNVEITCPPEKEIFHASIFLTVIAIVVFSIFGFTYATATNVGAIFGGVITAAVGIRPFRSIEDFMLTVVFGLGGVLAGSLVFNLLSYLRSTS